jgi:GNAT superfamily N-acetyltransferase
MSDAERRSGSTPHLRRARPEEAPALSALALRSKAYWGYDAAFLASCAAELTLSAEEIADTPTFVLEVDGTRLGFYSIERRDETRSELNFLFVEPEAIGRGYGRVLMEHAIERARALGSRVLEIQGDPNAAQFYRAVGGRLVGSRPSASIPGRVLPIFEVPL